VSEVRLTQLVQAGGCARKLPAEDLAEVLKQIPGFSHPWVSDATGPMDDAALVMPDASGRALVMTIDIITPIVDDPELFGRIAAANAISDVYAMGGKPEVALSFVGMPEALGLDVLAKVLGGGSAKAHEAGCAIVGGHSIRDVEPKFGLAVIGSVNASEAWTHRRGKAGQKLVLTKPLGVGVLVQAHRAGKVDAGAFERATGWMQRLNQMAADAGRRHGATAATDVTGFGLTGHVHHLAQSSGVAARIELGKVPIMDGALEAACAGLVPGGSHRNKRYVAGHLRNTEGAHPDLLTLVTDAQTSGGLVLAVPDSAAASAIVSELGEGAAIIGELFDGEPGTLHFV
jgi:selenide,water dikinase